MKKLFNFPVGKRLLILAILIRIIIMPFFYHPDIRNHYFHGSFLQTGVVDIYKYLADNKEKLPIKEDFNYYPLTYFLLGSFKMILSPFLGSGFESWVSNASVASVENPQIFRYLFILKLPYLVFDFAIAWLISKFFADRNRGKNAALIWLFNPFSIWIIYAYSSFDVMVAFLSLLSVYFFNKSKYLHSALILGLASCIKAYPLLFLPFYLILAPKVKEKAVILATTLLVFILPIIPFLSAEFQKTALVSGLTTRMFFPGVTIGFGESIIPATFALVFVYFLCFIFGVKEQLWKYCLSLFILLFSFIHFHISWLLWIMPFLVILWAKGETKMTTISFAFLAFLFLIPLLYTDRSMTFGLLSTLSNHYSLIPLPSVVVQKFYDTQVVMSVLHTAAAACGMVITWKLLNIKQA